MVLIKEQSGKNSLLMIIVGQQVYFAATSYDFSGNESGYPAEAFYNAPVVISQRLQLRLIFRQQLFPHLKLISHGILQRTMWG